MLDAVKLAMRPAIKTNAYDSEIQDLIKAARADLRSVGVIVVDSDPLVRQAIKTYCRLHFGNPENPDMLHTSYAEQKAQLITASGRTNWGGCDEP